MPKILRLHRHDALFSRNFKHLSPFGLASRPMTSDLMRPVKAERGNVSKFSIFNLQFTNQFSMTQFTNNYDLENRTGNFGEEIIKFCTTLKQNIINRPIISQLVRAGTSVGANYMEANAASSKRDFRNKIFICKKEAQETKHWLRMLAKCFPKQTNEIKRLWKESQELTMIFQKITSSLDRKNKREH